MKILVFLISISLVIQLSLLSFLDNFVFENSYEFSSKKIESNIDDSECCINPIIPTNAKDIDLSFEGRYVAYSKNNVLFVEDTKTKDVNEIPTNKDESVIYYTWLENRDVLIILKNVDRKIQLVSYNAKNDTQQVVEDICNYKEGLEFKEITMSVLTGVYYINIKDDDENKIYRVDRNDDLESVDTGVSHISTIKTMKHIDRLIYQADNNGQIFITSPNKKVNLNSMSQLSLLDVDDNDNVYIGEVLNNKITSIFYGKLDNDSSRWKNIELDTPIDKSNIYFNSKSEILVNDKDNNIVENLTTKQRCEYKGTFVKIIDKFIASYDEQGKLIYTYFNKEDAKSDAN